ncbi:MAG: MaoC family dehydratase [Proteobacteria bacterium]|nr:MaoC family dehydratase [Pseudomonadota bacterium]MBU4576194.1 MaoC family dehydratase [Pseudomonadota bacterium]MBU4597096.1 MaoC family dehydratase [Pseudomonadota bacterium]MBV1715338.1 MaoC family dehydratase [Desulfarculus sp.]
MLKDYASGERLPEIKKDIDQKRIDGWAALSGDFNRLHVDPVYAGKTHFKGTIAHGPMSLAFLNELMMTCFGRAWARGGLLREVRFLAPIRPGDSIRIGGVVEQVTEQGSGRTLHCRLEISKPNLEKSAVTGLAEVTIDGAQA